MKEIRLNKNNLFDWVEAAHVYANGELGDKPYAYVDRNE